MGKNKKQKRGELNQEELWDDSALLRSWQDAMDEYQFYHSVHARGENIEEVLRQAELGDDDQNPNSRASPPSELQSQLDDEMEDGEIVGREGGTVAGRGKTANIGDPLSTESSEVHEPKLPTAEKDTANASASTDQSQIVENIKMAYWWAGYYSGLYDAQQNAMQPSKK